MKGRDSGREGGGVKGARDIFVMCLGRNSRPLLSVYSIPLVRRVCDDDRGEPDAVDDDDDDDNIGDDESLVVSSFTPPST